MELEITLLKEMVFFYQTLIIILNILKLISLYLQNWKNFFLIDIEMKK